MPRLNRRTLCVALAGTGVAGAWLVLGDEGPPEANVDEPRLGPGEEISLSAEVGPVAGLRVTAGDGVGIPGLTGEVPVTVHVSDASLAPQPDMGDSSFPPTWVWDAPVDAVLELPVTVAEDAGAGEYTFGLRAVHADRHERTEFDVRIQVERT